MSDRAPRTVEGDRTVSPAAGVSWWTMRRVITIGACSAMAIVAFIVWKNDTPSKVDKNALPEKPTLAASSQILYKPPPSDDVAPVKRAVMQQPAPEQARPPAQPDVKKALDKDNTNSNSTPLFYSYAVPPLPDQFKPKKHTAAKEGEEGEGSSTTAIAYKGAQIPGLKAGNMGDTSLILPPGIVICTMSSVTESTVQGDFTCTIRDDVKSPMGIVLLDAGSYIQGTYDTKVANGQRRLRSNSVAAWDLKTHCAVPLGGAMADGMGRAGQEGDYDPHTWEKLGAAGIAMLTENVFQTLQSAMQQGNGNSYFQLNTGSMGSLVNELLRSNSQIPPTITIHQGGVSGFWIKEPIDFSACYRLATTEQ